GTRWTGWNWRSWETDSSARGGANPRVVLRVGVEDVEGLLAPGEERAGLRAAGDVAHLAGQEEVAALLDGRHGAGLRLDRHRALRHHHRHVVRVPVHRHSEAGWKTAEESVGPDVRIAAHERTVRPGRQGILRLPFELRGIDDGKTAGAHHRRGAEDQRQDPDHLCLLSCLRPGWREEESR